MRLRAVWLQAQLDAEDSGLGLLPPPWWAQRLCSSSAGSAECSVAWWLGVVDPHVLDAQLVRRKIGFLNACE